MLTITKSVHICCQTQNSNIELSKNSLPQTINHTNKNNLVFTKICNPKFAKRQYCTAMRTYLMH